MFLSILVWFWIRNKCSSFIFIVNNNFMIINFYPFNSIFTFLHLVIQVECLFVQNNSFNEHNIMKLREKIVSTYVNG